jgi:hypothetical protein
MDLASKYFNGVNWRYIDHSSGLEPMQSFAFDDTWSIYRQLTPLKYLLAKSIVIVRLALL